MTNAWWWFGNWMNKKLRKLKIRNIKISHVGVETWKTNKNLIQLICLVKNRTIKLNQQINVRLKIVRCLHSNPSRFIMITINQLNGEWKLKSINTLNRFNLRREHNKWGRAEKCRSLERKEEIEERKKCRAKLSSSKSPRNGIKSTKFWLQIESLELVASINNR